MLSIKFKKAWSKGRASKELVLEISELNPPGWGILGIGKRLLSKRVAIYLSKMVLSLGDPYQVGLIAALYV